MVILIEIITCYTNVSSPKDVSVREGGVIVE